MTDANLNAKVTADIADFVKKFDDMQQAVDNTAQGIQTSVEKIAMPDLKLTGGDGFAQFLAETDQAIAKVEHFGTDSGNQVDMFTTHLEHAGEQMGLFRDEVSVATNQAVGDLTTLAERGSGAFHQLVATLPEFVQRGIAELGRLKDEFRQLPTMLQSGAFIGAGAVLTAAVTMPIINMGQEAVMMADKMRQSEIAFTVMLGSAEKAGSFLRDLQAFAAATPFEFPELVQSAKKMMALGFSSEQVIPNLRAVGDAVAGLGGNAGTFDRIILALGQMQAKGQVMSGEMRQLAEAGIPAWDILATKLGVTVPEAMDMVQKKAVDATVGVAAIMEGMGQRFGGLMEQQSRTIEGTLANLRDTVGFIMTDIGRELIETLKIREGLAVVQEFTKGFLSWFKELDQGTKQVLLVLTGTFAMGGPILVAVGAFMAAMAVVTAPLLVGGAIVAGIVAGIALLILNWQKVKDTGIALWTGLKNTVVGVVTVMVDKIYDNLVGRFVRIVEGVKQSTEAVAGFFYDLWTKVTRRSYVPDMVDDIEANMQRLEGSALVVPASHATQTTAHLFRTLQTSATEAVHALADQSELSAERFEKAVERVKLAMAALEARQQLPAGTLQSLTNLERDPATDPENVVAHIQDVMKGLKNTAAGGLGPQIESLDIAQSSAQRAAIAQTVRTIETGKFTYIQAQNEMASVATQTWGSITGTVSGAFAQQLISGNDWAATMRQLGTSVISNFANMVLQMTTQWVIAELTRTAATETANATIATSTATTGSLMMGVFSMAATAMKALMIGVARAAVGVIGLVVSGISVVLNSVSTLIGFMLATIGKMLIELGTALQSVPIIGNIIGAILIGAGGMSIALGAALPGIVAGLTGTLAAGVGALSAAIPAFATGGAVFGPTLALVGENASRSNPEYIGHANQLGLNSGGGPITIILEIGGRHLGKAVIPHLHGPLRRQAIGA